MNWLDRTFLFFRRIQNNGVDLPGEPTLNVIGATFVDDPDNRRLNMTVTGGGGTPGGSDTQVQYNSSGSFAGATGLRIPAAGTVAFGTGSLPSQGTSRVPAGFTMFGVGSGGDLCLLKLDSAGTQTLWMGSDDAGSFMVPFVVVAATTEIFISPNFVDVITATPTRASLLKGVCIPPISPGDADHSIASTEAWTDWATTLTGNRTGTLPASPILGEVHVVSWAQLGGHTFTIAGGGHNINGAASVTIVADYGSIEVRYNGTEWRQL